MLQDIRTCSFQYIKNILKSLDQFDDYVFWIRNDDLSQQLYVSESYRKIWEQDIETLFDIPLIWLSYLREDNWTEYMQKFQDRHLEDYLDQEKNLIFYQVTASSGEARYVRDRSFRFQSRTGEQYVAGITQKQTTKIWYPQYENHNPDVDNESIKIYKYFFSLLKKEFGLTLMKPLQVSEAFLQNYRKFINKSERFSFSKRELECLHHICQGKSYKEVARAMSISPRTVETHLGNIRDKTNCCNKAEVISRFAHYF